MFRALALWLPTGLLLALFGIGIGIGCSDDLDTRMRRPSSNPIGMPDGLPEAVVDPTKQPENCPASLTKEGETCPSVTEANITCRYVTRVCPNASEVVQSMCCGRGGIWVLCGTVDPCPEPEPGEPDAGI